MGLLTSNITYKCLLRMLCPVRRPKTTLFYVLLKVNNHALVAKLGPAFNSRACHFVLQGPRHISKCWLSIQRFIFLLMFFLRPPRRFGPTNLWTERPLARLLAILFPRAPACPGTSTTTLCVSQRYQSTPSVTLVPREKLFWQLKRTESRLTIRANTKGCW